MWGLGSDDMLDIILQATHKNHLRILRDALALTMIVTNECRQESRDQIFGHSHTIACLQLYTMKISTSTRTTSRNVTLQPKVPTARTDREQNLAATFAPPLSGDVPDRRP
jgi:hypothetical protein